MDNNNWRAAQGQMAPGPPQGQVGGGEVTAVPSVTPPAAMDAGDWRTHLQADHRQRIVNKIMDTLKRHIPSSGPEGLEDLKKIAIRFEEKIYAAATSQTDYLRRISVKMLTMETKSQNPMASSLQPNAGKNPPEVHGMQSQIQNQQLSMPVVSGQSQPRQQLIAQKMQANMMSSGVQSSAILTSAILNPVNLTQVAMPNVIGQNSNLQNMQSMPSIAQNPVGNSMGQGIPSNVFTNSQRLLPGRQQQVANQQQQQPQPPQQHNQNAQTFLYQQQFQNHQLMKQKLQQGGMAQSLMQQQNLLPPGQIQTSSQAVMQPSVMQSAPPSSLQQNKQSSVPQVTQPVLQPQSQSVVRQQQQPQQQASLVHQQQTSISQQTLLQAPPQPQQQQHQMIGQQSNAMSIQHNQLIGQPNCIQDAQQQQQRLLGQQSNIPNLQPQQLMGHQNSLSNMHQSQMGPQGNVSGLHQQSMLGNQSGNSGMPTNQHSMHMLQQSKVPVQQQMQQNAMTMLQSQNQLSQQQVSKQQMVSHIQSQPVPLQHLPPQSSLLQREVQQRLPTSGSLLQQQNVVEQQKQLFQSQRANPEASSNSTAQMGNINAGDWQEEVYQKIKSMKDMYFLDLNDLLMKIATKLQQHDFLPQQPRNEPLERLRYFKGGLERVVGFLRLNKNDVQIAHRDKLATVEKQIMNILNQNRPRRSASLQQGQPSQPQMPAVQHSQLQSQISQRPPQDNQMNSQMQPMNIQSSMTTMQQNNLTSIHHSSLSSVPLSSSQHNMMNSLQPSTSVDIGQSNALNPLQQTNSNLIRNQHIKQEQQTLPAQQLKQHMHQRQMQQMLARQQVMQQQQQQHQQQPQLQQHQQQQQVKQHHPSQLSGHGMSPSHQMTDSGDLKLRQQMGVKSAVFQQHHLNCQRAVYHHQLKSGSPFPVSPPQVLQAHSPQLPPHPSPQIDQQNMLISMAKAGTSLQSANSPFVSPSPSTPLAPSPMPGDSEKLNSSISSLPNVGNVGHSRVTTLTAAVQSLAIGTPGISASPLLAELSCLDGALVNGSTAVSCKSDVVEQPLERLIKAVKSISHKTLTDSVGDISSVVSMVDRIAGSAPGNGWRAAVGEELVATTKCHLQARNFSTQDGPAAKRMRRFTSAMPSNVISSVSSVYLTVKQLNDSDAFELKSTAMSSIRRPKIEANHALVQEIREINRLLIETVLEISDDDVDPTAVAAAAEGCEGIIVKCSFSAVALGHLKSQYASAQTSPIQPLRLLIPTNYPHSSPILVDKFPIAVSKEYEYLSMKAKSSFSTSLRTLSQPMSLSEIAKTWDVCAHAVVSEFAQLSRGGTFSSTYGTWESFDYLLTC